MRSFDTNVAVRLLIRESSREASALPVLTFDERFARAADVELVPET